MGTLGEIVMLQYICFAIGIAFTLYLLGFLIWFFITFEEICDMLDKIEGRGKYYKSRKEN